MPRSASIKLFLLATFFFVPGGVAQQPPSTPLIGTWILKTVAGRPPATINIKSWQISFSADGTWKYSGDMMGPFDGTHLQGSGSWTLKDGILSYTAGSNQGNSKATVKARVLSLSPDPVVKPGGKTDVDTEYQKAGN
jgi:hypothetical protein